jgi:CheY-like chemotaxis protein
MATSRASGLAGIIPRLPKSPLRRVRMVSAARIDYSRGAMNAPSRLAGLSILVVEDDRDNREMFETYLAHLGATVRTAATSEDGLEQFKAAPAAVVVADIAMPGRGGLWLLHEIRSLAGAAHVPVIAVTGRGLPYERQMLRDAGFTALAIKPVDLDGLAAIILAVSGR